MARFSAKRIKRKVVRALELPRDIVLDLPTINMLGKEELVVEGSKGIAEYTPDVMRIKTSLGILRIKGAKLRLAEINGERIVVFGEIMSIEF